MPRGGRREGAGRPVGSISKTTAEIKALAQQHGPAIITKLAELSGVIPGNVAESQAVQVQAMRELLDRGFGRSTQPLSGDADGAPIAYSFRWADALPPPEPEPIAEVDDANDAGGDIRAEWNTC
jgi:hypothetical protein